METKIVHLPIGVGDFQIVRQYMNYAVINQMRSRAAYIVQDNIEKEIGRQKVEDARHAVSDIKDLNNQVDSYASDAAEVLDDLWNTRASTLVGVLFKLAIYSPTTIQTEDDDGHNCIASMFTDLANMLGLVDESNTVCHLSQGIVNEPIKDEDIPPFNPATVRATLEALGIPVEQAVSRLRVVKKPA